VLGLLAGTQGATCGIKDTTIIWDQEWQSVNVMYSGAFCMVRLSGEAKMNPTGSTGVLSKNRDESPHNPFGGDLISKGSSSCNWINITSLRHRTAWAHDE
jgi:hypothetical protein